MATKLSFEQIEEAKEGVRDKLAAAMQRRRDLSFKTFQPGATDTDKRNAQAAGEAVVRLQTELDTLEYGGQKVRVEDQERRAAEMAVHARELAVEQMALIHLHFWAVEAIDQSLVDASNFREELDDISNQIQLGVGGFGDGLQGDSARRSFLSLLGIGAMTDIPAMFDRDVRIGRYARELPLNREAALRTLAKVLPDVLDPDVQKEGLDRARARQLADKESKEGGSDDETR